MKLRLRERVRPISGLSSSEEAWRPGSETHPEHLMTIYSWDGCLSPLSLSWPIRKMDTRITILQGLL